MLSVIVVAVTNAPLPLHNTQGEADRAYCERYAGVNGGNEATKLSIYPFLTEVRDSRLIPTLEYLKLPLTAPLLLLLRRSNTVCTLLRTCRYKIVPRTYSQRIK